MKTRRGLSTVVGMVFGIIAILTSIGYVTYSLTTLDQYNQATLSRNQQSIDAGKENFQLYSTKIINGKFNITIANTGNLPINVTRMWVQNTTATDWINYYTINKAVNPGFLLTNIGQNSPVGANPSYAYNIKLVTGRGNAMQFSIGSANSNPLFMSAQMIPASLHNYAYVTLLYEVTNNMTSNNSLVNIQPAAPSCNPSGDVKQLVSGPTPPSYPFLSSGSTAIFKWVYNMSGTVRTSVTCTVSLQNGLASNTASDTALFVNGTK